MEDRGEKRTRRVRYKGTHPRAFNEKYKELNPELYAQDVEKIILQGKTPAGMHRSIMVEEIMDFLDVKPEEVGLDATLGYGGHSAEILKRITPGGKLFATDVDPYELPKTTERLKSMGFGDNVFFPRHLNFSQIDELFLESGPLNFVLADLGVSSMQIDNPERGFSFKVDGPLDLRLNPQEGQAAYELLRMVSRDELEAILFGNSDEPYFESIADAIITKRKNGIKITTTQQLKETIKEALSDIPEKNKADEIKKACQRTFQALRIEVNNEFDVLDHFLLKLPDVLALGGRVAILTFHSGEDRRVKKAFQYFYNQGIFSEISDSPIKASAEEVAANPRSKSAKLRCAVR